MGVNIENGKLTGEKIPALLPRQYASKWKNDEGKTFYVVLYVEQDGYELKKLFIPTNDFRDLKIKSFMANNVVLNLGQDEEDRNVLLSLDMAVDKKK